MYCGDCGQGDTLMASQKQLEDLADYIKHNTSDVIAFDKKGAYSMDFDYLKWLKRNSSGEGFHNKVVVMSNPTLEDVIAAKIMLYHESWNIIDR
jgi:hypothetical protein